MYSGYRNLIFVLENHVRNSGIFTFMQAWTRCNLADYKNCCNACTANPCCEQGFGIFQWILKLEFIRGVQGICYWILIFGVFIVMKSAIEVLCRHVPRMMLCYWTGGIYIGTRWKSGQIWCTAGYIAVEWLIQSARYTRSQKGKTRQMKVCFLITYYKHEFIL